MIDGFPELLLDGGSPVRTVCIQISRIDGLTIYSSAQANAETGQVLAHRFVVSLIG
jgi:hypothetical protein